MNLVMDCLVEFSGEEVPGALRVHIGNEPEKKLQAVQEAAGLGVRVRREGRAQLIGLPDRRRASRWSGSRLLRRSSVPP